MTNKTNIHKCRICKTHPPEIKRLKKDIVCNVCWSWLLDDMGVYTHEKGYITLFKFKFE